MLVVERNVRPDGPAQLLVIDETEPRDGVGLQRVEEGFRMGVVARAPSSRHARTDAEAL